MATFSSFKGKNSRKGEQFWKWFEQNEQMLFNFEMDTEKIFDTLSMEMEKIHPDLTFEIGPLLGDSTREFVISAGGVIDAFPVVESLYHYAPKLQRWYFTKFRPRRSPINDIYFEDKFIKSEEVFYKLFKDGDKLGIILFLDGYDEKEQGIFGSIGYLYLDEALGEYDVETKIGFIEFHPHTSAHFEGSSPLNSLAANVDDYFGGNIH